MYFQPEQGSNSSGMKSQMRILYRLLPVPEVVSVPAPVLFHRLRSVSGLAVR